MCEDKHIIDIITASSTYKVEKNKTHNIITSQHMTTKFIYKSAVIALSIQFVVLTQQRLNFLDPVKLNREQ